MEIRPAIIAPISGRKTIAWIIGALAFHQIDVFNGNRPAIAEVHHQHGETDRRFRSRHGQHQQREHLSDDVAEEGRKCDQINVHREQDQFDGHQDDDDVLPVEKDAEDSQRKQDCPYRKIVSKTNRHCTHSAASASCSPCPEATFRTLIACPAVRAFCTLMSSRLTRTCWRNVSTMAPLMATSVSMPASCK